jgi:hypothetical protein
MKIAQIFNYILLFVFIFLQIGCSKKCLIDPICLNRLEIAVGEVRKLEASYETAGITQIELRDLSNKAAFALGDAADLWEAKGQVAHELDIQDLNELVKEWCDQLVMISGTKLEGSGQKWVGIRVLVDPRSDALGADENNWNDPSWKRLTFCEVRNLLIKYPSIGTSLTYYDDGNGHRQYPPSILQELIDFEPLPFPEGPKKFFEHFKTKYSPKKYGWDYTSSELALIGSTVTGGFIDFGIYYDPQVVKNTILSDLSKKSRELDLKIKSRISN